MAYAPATIAAAKRRVEKGTALLDEKLPGWESNIDLDRLQLADVDQCVLGQLFAESQSVPAWVADGYGSLKDALRDGCSQEEAERSLCEAHYNLGQYVLGLSDKDSANHGFMTLDDTKITYTLLDLTWINTITARQAQK